MKEVQKIYRFSDFTIENYKKLLQLAVKEYEFIDFFQIKQRKYKYIIWRHDVEFSIPIALKMAQIEHSLGVKSTYFFQVHGDFYNILEKNTFNSIKTIQALGHDIGLHFDSHFWDIKNKDQLEKCMKIDKKIFVEYFNITPKVFSFHNTNKFVLSCDDESYAGMLNVYSKRIKNKYAYCSDSTGFWRYEVLEDYLREAKVDVLQVLIHDGMWQEEVLPPRRRVYRVIDDHAKFMKKSYDETLKKFGAKNIDWDGEIII